MEAVKTNRTMIVFASKSYKTKPIPVGPNDENNLIVIGENYKSIFAPFRVLNAYYRDKSSVKWYYTKVPKKAMRTGRYDSYIVKLIDVINATVDSNTEEIRLYNDNASDTLKIVTNGLMAWTMYKRLGIKVFINDNLVEIGKSKLNETFRNYSDEAIIKRIVESV